VLLSRDFKSIFTHKNASYETSISCKKSLVRRILLVSKKAIQNYFPISHEKTYYKCSGRRSCVCFYEKNLIDSILRHLNIDHEEYVDVVEAYRRLAVRPRQSIEINEGDHGKVILWCL
jgi:hypothetical protein